jgi:hypothetical protein
MEEIEIYYDHYKDSFVYLKDYLKQRDRLTIYCTILVGIVFLTYFLPTDFDTFSKTLIKNKLSIELSDLKIIESLILFVLLALVMKYYQIIVFIQRQYDYIHEIESNLTSTLKEFKIDREGDSYLKNYPILLSAADIIYKTIFPLLLLVSVFIKWIQIFKKSNDIKFLSLFTFDSLIIFCILALTILYLSWIHFSDFKKTKV